MKETKIWDFLYLRKINQDDINKQGEWLKKYDKYLPLLTGDIVLDLGCGEGVNAVYYRKLGYNVIAADFSQVVLDRIKQRNPDICVKNFDMREGLPFENNSISLIVASLSLHYFDLEQTRQIINSIYSCLKPGGYFIYRVNSYKEFERNKDNMLRLIEEDFYKTTNGKNKRYFSVESMARLLQDQFQIIENFESELSFNGVCKYAVEGIVSKPKDNAKGATII